VQKYGKGDEKLKSQILINFLNHLHTINFIIKKEMIKNTRAFVVKISALLLVKTKKYKHDLNELDECHYQSLKCHEINFYK
jgi:hypothetical protein